MTEKEGALRMQSNRRWSIVRPGRPPYELTSGARLARTQVCEGRVFRRISSA
jgi:hypothetical protein